MIIDDGPEPSVINLKPYLEQRRGYKCGTNFTHVGPYWVDEALQEVECSACGAKLNAIHCLVEMARSETRWLAHRETYLQQKKEIESKSKAKCQHCGKFTRLGIRGVTS